MAPREAEQEHAPLRFSASNVPCAQEFLPAAMITARDIHKSFPSRDVLRGVSFNLTTAAITGLIGPSGGGKSLLLKILAGVLRPDSGTVEIRERERTPTRNQPLSVSLMFQEGALFDSMNVIDNVAFPLVEGRVPVAKLPPAERDEVLWRVEEILGRVGLINAALKVPGQLSGGMRRRVSLARALVARPELVLLDDPTSGLDPVASSVIMDLIGELHREYLPTTVMVSHDLRRLLPASDYVLALFDGRIIFHDRIALLREAALPELHHFISCRFNMDELPQAAMTTDL